MTQNQRELSNLSYTNKDFGTIYPELLDYVKKISYKWDPTISDESDPGVVLLKLAALVADKNNYNIDKNILELFPLSVTQRQNAMEIYDHSGYAMRYYQSAIVDVQLTLKKEPDISDNDLLTLTDEYDKVSDLKASTKPSDVRIYTIPKFTTVSDSSNNIVYTTIEDVEVRSDHKSVTVTAIEGTPEKYKINGATLITADLLDHNRLYFTESDIAQNGIFIKNNNTVESDWVPVDNLSIYPLGTPCYKFGITNNLICYIEFPDDIQDLIGDGLEITYIRTLGTQGAITAKKLSQFFADVSCERRLSGQGKARTQNGITLTSENVFITNLLPSTSGEEPETIDEAYENYQKVKNTFETLVSLKDYSDFMITNECASNAFVCDRTNDPQSTYKVIEGTDDNYSVNTIIRKELVDSDDIVAVDKDNNIVGKPTNAR